MCVVILSEEYHATARAQSKNILWGLRIMGGIRASMYGYEERVWHVADHPKRAERPSKLATPTEIGGTVCGVVWCGVEFSHRMCHAYGLLIGLCMWTDPYPLFNNLLQPWYTP